MSAHALLAPARTGADSNGISDQTTWERLVSRLTNLLRGATEAGSRASGRPEARSGRAVRAARDGLRKDARKDAYGKLFAKLDGLTTQHREDVAAASKGILEVQGETLVAPFGGGGAIEFQPFVAVADEKSVEADFRVACRTLTGNVARKYADHLATAEEDDDGLRDAHVRVAALARVEEVPDPLDREAERIAKKWFADHRVAIKGLSDERQAVYDEIKSMSPQPRAIEVKRPRIRTEETRGRRRQGVGDPYRTPHVRRQRRLPGQLIEQLGDPGARQGDGAPGLPSLVSEPLSPVGRCVGRRLPE